MNNIKSFNEYTGIELEQIVYDQELNEGIMGSGIRGFFNKKAASRVRAELADEIEMSKSIMEGIKAGLESLNENFDTIRDNLESSDNKVKGEKQKALDSIMKILEDSRKNTWDLKELIDEGEIDYVGFTANVGIASIAYFGILLTPFRAAVMIHKGYNYFFNIVKNTIRKSLVMLQLNFDQFENLIITQGFKSAGYLQADDSTQKISEFYGNINAQLFGDKGSLKGKRGSRELEMKLKAAKQQFDQQMKADKQFQQADNAYNCLDMYNNTYTKSLEALRQYSGDDVQKHLDAIKTSMSKLAGQEVDLQTYSELIIAAAEEHAYKVSSSIYNKFAKMTEVFSLPNQQKLLDLILEANKEKETAAKKIRKEKKKSKELQEKIELKSKESEEGLKVFKSIDGVEIEELEGGEVLEDGETIKKYNESKIKAEKWTYEEFSKLDKNDQDSFDIWLNLHPEVLKKCDKTLQVYITTNPKSVYFDSSYIDSLIDYIGPYIKEKKKKLKESYFLNFDEFVFESSDESKSEDETKSDYELSDDDKKEIDDKIENMKSSMKSSIENLFTAVFGDEFESIEDLENIEMDDEKQAKLDYLISICKDSDDIDKNVLTGLIDFKDSIDSDGTVHSNYYITFNDLDENQIKDLDELYENKDVSIAALKSIGENVLNDKTFKKNSKVIVNIINKCIESKKENISFMTYTLLTRSIERLDYLRKHDYSTVEETNKSEE